MNTKEYYFIEALITYPRRGYVIGPELGLILDIQSQLPNYVKEKMPD